VDKVQVNTWHLFSYIVGQPRGVWPSGNVDVRELRKGLLLLVLLRREVLATGLEIGNTVANRLSSPMGPFWKHKKVAAFVVPPFMGGMTSGARINAGTTNAAI
jgi:hypothetical protein